MRKDRIIYTTESSLIVFRLGLTTNAKIAEKREKIVQQYSFDLNQVDYVRECMVSGEKISHKKFFSLADSVCFDCPFRGYLKCYTHKFRQAGGFISTIQSILRDGVEFSEMTEEIQSNIIGMSQNRFVRFGSYGEPTLVDFELVNEITQVAKSWTGYSHQWRQPKNDLYKLFFMASCETITDQLKAEQKGWRGFVVRSEDQVINAIQCPASKELNISNCSKCGLCSGSKGKGRKSIKILKH